MTVVLARDWHGYRAGAFVFDLLPEQVKALEAGGYLVYSNDGEGGRVKAIESPNRDKMLRRPARKK